MAELQFSKCPKCQADLGRPMAVCTRCGLIFAKYDPAPKFREQIERPAAKTGHIIRNLGIFLTGFLLLGGLLLSMTSGKSSSATASSKEPERITPETPGNMGLLRVDGMAFHICKDFVKLQLESRSTQRFASSCDSSIRFMSNDTYQISSYLDSEDYFGDITRINFDCRVKNLGEGKWKLLGLQIEDPVPLKEASARNKDR
jgi:hypothetical protein